MKGVRPEDGSVMPGLIAPPPVRLVSSRCCDQLVKLRAELLKNACLEIAKSCFRLRLVLTKRPTILRSAPKEESTTVLDVRLSTPRELGGAGGPGTNPEQLFAAGYTACFLGALKFVAGRERVALPRDVAVKGTATRGNIDVRITVA